MKRGILVALVLGLLVASLACNFGSGDRESTPEVVQSTPEVVQGTGGGQGFTITVDNMSSDDVCYVLISSSNEDSWGEDWLGENDIITAGKSPKMRPLPLVGLDWLHLKCAMRAPKKFVTLTSLLLRVIPGVRIGWVQKRRLCLKVPCVTSI